MGHLLLEALLILLERPEGGLQLGASLLDLTFTGVDLCGDRVDLGLAIGAFGHVSVEPPVTNNAQSALSL